jgi:NAD(P)-dependent dehydrogenase (short-subunit alcohol dehydrogenase family)
MPNVVVMTENFTGSVALVVGASKGIGAGTAVAFAEAGAAVVLAARDEAAVRGLAEQIIAAGGEATGVRADAADPGSMAEVVEVAVSSYGGLHLAFNNATAGPMPAPLADIDIDEFDQGIATNVRGTFLGMKYQLPAMLATDDSRPKAVVNMASSAALHPVANLAAYVAGKAAIIGLTKVAALDYADRGVRANVVAPGPILTHHLQAAGPEAQRLAGLATPMRRTGTVEEVARTVLWLCSPAASFINGAVVPIDGGQSAGSKPERMYRQGKGMSP